MPNVKDVFTAYCDENLDVVEKYEIEGSDEEYRSIPKSFEMGEYQSWLQRHTRGVGRVWKHQSLALEKIDSGKNVVVSTGTASGKSLIFQLPIMREILESDGVALILYPMKALLADQLARWQSMAQELRLPENTVAAVYGGGVPREERQYYVQNSRVIVATPDVIQAWFMPRIVEPAFGDFLAKLKYLVLDEAHSYESVFGSNAAYLFRRFLIAREKAAKKRRSDKKLQIIAATATIASATDHMKRLTGLEFEEVGEQDDGAPSHPRTLLHVHVAETMADGETVLKDIVKHLATDDAEDMFIAFRDSRQGVERVAIAAKSDTVLPYRSGYEKNDRTKIDEQLRAGQLRGVISTSALELGIDIAGLSVGLNLGVPQSKKAFRQRLGRVGRSHPGVFAILAPRHAFAQMGSSLKEYYEGSVEPSHLYLDNRFIQFAHAKCLADELEQLQLRKDSPPSGSYWPESFPKIYDMARPGGRRPSREFEYMAKLGEINPHMTYPLRQIGQVSYHLKRDAEEIGDIVAHQAIREAYPGAIYFHMKKSFRVLEWKANSRERAVICLTPWKDALTTPILYKNVNCLMDPVDIVSNRIKHDSNKGIFAEANLTVTEKVVGYRSRGDEHRYEKLRREDSRMRKQLREFSTTGIVIRICEPWAQGKEGAARREAIAEALKAMLLREKSIAQIDIDSAHTNIAFYHNGVPQKITDAIVIYDSIYGGLRLTEPLFDDFRQYLDRLRDGAQKADSEALLPLEDIDRLQEWYDSLKHGDGSLFTAPKEDAAGRWEVYAKGSIVSLSLFGKLVEKEIIQPVLDEEDGEPVLRYLCKDTDSIDDSVTNVVAADKVRPTGDNCKKIWWDPVTNTYSEKGG